MKYRLLVITLLSVLFLNAQTEEEILSALENVSNTEESKSLQFKNYEVETFYYNPTEETKDEYASSSIGDVFKYPDVYFKRVKNEKTESRVSYVYLNGNELSLEKINKIREKILKKYNSGVSFAKLSEKYSMDGSSKKGGDLGWYKDGVMVSKFENSVKEHNKDDIFTIDILIPLKKRKWYYVVLKTYNERITEEGYTFIVVGKKELDSK